MGVHAQSEPPSQPTSEPINAPPPGIELSTGDADFSTQLPGQFSEPLWDGPDGRRRPLWRWLQSSNGRHRGLGGPLERESWLTRPLQISPLGGAIVADGLLKGRVEGSTGYLTGLRMGWDFDHFWGLETRFGLTSFGLDSPIAGVELGNAKGFLWDTGVLWYPLGDATWRPYVTLGMGLADFRFYDEFARLNHPSTFTMPYGGGIKYRANERWALRFDVTDALSLDGGRQADVMHNLLITGSIEARFGFGPRRSYYPWNPSRAWY